MGQAGYPFLRSSSQSPIRTKRTGVFDQSDIDINSSNGIAEILGSAPGFGVLGVVPGDLSGQPGRRGCIKKSWEDNPP
jgi:hypothetical protein